MTCFRWVRVCLVVVAAYTRFDDVDVGEVVLVELFQEMGKEL